jgi:hypothetical protein
MTQPYHLKKDHTMKRSHIAEFGERKLELSLSFSTSLKIKEQVASPTLIVEELMQSMLAAENGLEHRQQFKFDESNVVKILQLGNADYEGLSFNEMGNLCAEVGWMMAYAVAIRYLREMVMGRSKELEVKEETEGGEEGN